MYTQNDLRLSVPLVNPRIDEGHAKVLFLNGLDRILPMFHAAGWTYPWSITFAFSTQVSQLPVLLATSSAASRNRSVNA